MCGQAQITCLLGGVEAKCCCPNDSSARHELQGMEVVLCVDYSLHRAVICLLFGGTVANTSI